MELEKKFNGEITCPKKYEKLSLNFQKPMNPDKVTHTCNPNDPMVRWDWEDSWNLMAQLAWFHDRYSTEQDTALIRWKVRTDTCGFPVIFIHAP